MIEKHQRDKAAFDYYVRLGKALRCFMELDGDRSLHEIGEAVFEKRKAGSHQSRMSKLLKFLHEAMNLPRGTLCTQDRGKVPRYTESGRLFLRNHAEKILRQIEERTGVIQQLLEKAREDVSGSVTYKIAMVPTMNSRWLLPFMKALAANKATRHLKVNPPATMLSDAVEKAVREGRHEIGILQFPDDPEAMKELQTNYRATRLFDDPFVAAMHCKHPWARKKSVRLKDFDGVQGYYRFVGGRPTQVIEERLKGAGVNIEPVETFEEFGSVEAAVAGTVGEQCVTIVPRLFATNAHIWDDVNLASLRPVGNVVLKLISDFGAPRRMGFICKRGPLTPTAELIVEALRKEAGRA